MKKLIILLLTILIFSCKQENKKIAVEQNLSFSKVKFC